MEDQEENKLSWILSTGVVQQVGSKEGILVGDLTLQELSNQQEEVYIDLKYLIDEWDYVYLTTQQYKDLTNTN